MVWNNMDLSQFKGQDNEKNTENSFELELDLSNGNNESIDSEPTDTESEPEESIEIEEENQEEEEQNSEEETVEEEEVKTTKRGRSRAKRKIEALSRENEQKDKALAEMMARLEALEKGTESQQVTNKITQLEDKARNIRSQIALANKEGDYELAANLQGDLADVVVDIKVMKATIASEPKTKTQSPKPEVQTEPNSYPEAYEDWVTENEWFESPSGPHERRLAKLIKEEGRRLVQEDGFEIDDDEFYVELDKAAKRFVKEKGLKVDGFVVEKPKAKTTKRAPTADVSRDSGVKKVGNKIKVKLTEEEQKIARKFNMTNEEYAKQKIAEENKTNGWTQVF